MTYARYCGKWRGHALSRYGRTSNSTGVVITPSSIRRLCRKHGLGLAGGLLRSPPYAVLPRSFLLGDDRLRSDFGLEEYKKLAAIIGRLKGKASVSLKDKPDIRRIFADFQIDTVPITYMLAGGSRGAQRKEVII